MKKILMLTCAISIIITAFAQATLYEKVDNGSIKISINDNQITIKLKDANGEFRQLEFDRDDFDSIDQFKKHFNISQNDCLEIQDELIIDGDIITIDGQKYSCDQIKTVQLYSEFDEGVSFDASLPYYSKRVSKARTVDVDYDTDDGLFSFGDLVIDAGETVYGDVVALTGDVKVYGEVMGDVVAVFGDVIMYDGSYASGDVVTPFGQIVKRGSIRVGGETMPRSNLKLMGHESDVDFDITARYNRVEGFTLLGGINYEDYHNELPEFYFDYGYAFSLKKWDLAGGFKQKFGNDFAFYFGADLYQGASTSDQWMFTTHENTIASLFFKEDYHDFFYRKGLKLYAGQKLWDDFYVQASYYAEDYQTLTKNTNKAIFGGKKNFRENFSTILDPAILASIEGERRTMAFSLGWDNRDSDYWPRRGQLVEFNWESAGDDGIIGGLGGAHSYDAVSMKFANYLPLNRKQHIGLILHAGHSDDNLPLDKWFFLGGPGSLRGYEYKEFAGDRFLLANLDYYFEFSHDFAMAVFGDIGKAGFSESEYKNNDFKSDLGMGIMFQDAFRIDIAQRLDDMDKSPVVMARAMIHF